MPRVIVVLIGPVILEKQIFKCRQCIFAISISFSFGRGIGPSFEQLLLCAKLFQMSICMFFAIFYYFSFEKGEDLHLNRYEFPESNDALCKSLIKKGSEEFEMFLSIFVMLLLEKSMTLHFNKHEFNTQRCLLKFGVRMWFTDSAGAIDFYQMSLSHSEATILHESIIIFYIIMLWVSF